MSDQDKNSSKLRNNKVGIMILGGILLVGAVILIVTIVTWNKKSVIDKDGQVVPTSSEGVAGVTGTGSEGLSTDNVVNAGTNTTADATIHTGKLSETGNGYEGVDGTGDYNYGEALQKSLLFYELQRSGDLPTETRCNWRGDSGLSDGSDVGMDLTGGLYDAGDHVKFNLPMAYTSSILGWSVYEDYASYEKSGQLPYVLDDIRWINDYLIKCHPEDEVYYYQVGNGSTDHSWWGPAEVMQMERPAYCVTKQNPGSAVVAEAAAALAVGSIVFADEDKAYSDENLQHAKTLYSFAVSTKSDAGYTMASGFYDSHSGFYDELSWAAIWLYLATGEDSYLKEAKDFYTQACQDYNWALCWDDVHIGAAVMLAKTTKDATYSQAVEKHLDYWTDGTADGERITYTPQGLAWLDSWGSLRYATTTAFVASVYSEWDGCDAAEKTKYWDFAVSQAGYALGDTGFSYLIGFGDKYPQNPHHRTAQGSYCNNMNEPSKARHTLYGALVGGPDATDGYTDTVTNYNTNEVACDYNAGFTGLMAKLYSRYYGKTLVDFGAVEVPAADEIYADAGINVDGTDFIEIKAYVYNQSAWPARTPKNLELRYFVDLSEVYTAGGSAADIEVTTNYMQAGNATGLKVWDEDNHIYYLCVDFSDANIYPGGQDSYKKEIQVRLRNPNGTWDNGNDWSYTDLTKQGVSPATHLGLYEDGTLIYGSEPASGTNAGSSVAGSQSSGTGSQSSGTGNGSQTPATGSNTTPQSASSDTLTVKMDYAGMQSSASGITGTMTITNNSATSISVSDMSIAYYFTKDNDKTLQFSCYHAAINSKSGSYTALSKVSGNFSDYDQTDADTVCSITFGDKQQLASGDTMTVNFCINHSDWSNFTTTNDYSGQKTENIVISKGKDVIFGTRP